MTKNTYTTLTSYHKARYGQWAGNEAGYAADPCRCAKNVADRYKFKQCSRPRGHGPEEAFCKIHSPEREAAKAEKAKAVYEADMAKWRLTHYGPRFAEALRLIAEGHNDPRACAREALSILNKE